MNNSTNDMASHKDLTNSQALGDERIVVKSKFLETLAPLPTPETLQDCIPISTAQAARSAYEAITKMIVKNPVQVFSSEGLDVTSLISSNKDVFDLVNVAVNRFGYELRVDEKKTYRLYVCGKE